MIVDLVTHRQQNSLSVTNNYVSGDPQYDFFEQNPELRYEREINKLISEHGSKVASKVMWTAYLLKDPGSKLFKYPEDQRRELVKENFITDQSDNFLEEHADIIALYPRLAVTKKARDYQILADKYSSLVRFVNELDPEDDSEFNKLVRVFEKLDKIKKSLDQMEQDYVKEREEITSKKGRGEKMQGRMYKNKG